MPVTHVDQLPAPSFDGQKQLIQFGDGARPDQWRLRWKESTSQWTTRPQVMFQQVDGFHMDAASSTPGAWRYLSFVDGNPGQIGQSSYGWMSSAIRQTQAAFAAGLTLQLRSLQRFWVFDLDSDRQLGFVLYPLAPGDLVDNTILPAPNVAMVVDALVGVRRWYDTGWQDSLIQSSDAPDLAPHLYARHNTTKGTTAPLQGLISWYRWVARP